jgi:uncharacterized protein (DUF952 family)
MRALEPTLYHLALAADWDEAVATGADYTTSTLGVTLAEQGFIHCSFPDQVQRIADLVYAGRDDVVLLTLSTGLVAVPVRVDEVGADAFPHLYGPLNTSAVVHVRPLTQGTDGRLDAAPPPIA